VGEENEGRTKVVYSDGGDICIHDRSTGQRRLLMKTKEAEADPRFTRDGSKVVYTRSGNLFSIRLSDGYVEQLTDIRPPAARPTSRRRGPRARRSSGKRKGCCWPPWTRWRRSARSGKRSKRRRIRGSRGFYKDGNACSGLQLTPDEKTVVALVDEPAADAVRAQVSFPVTESGYTEPRPTRTKAGDMQGKSRMALISVETAS